MTTQSCKISKI